MANNGFFNSNNGDRMYNASDFGRMFEGLISDGVISGWGNAFSAHSESGGGKLYVDSGRAYFNGTWLATDETTELTITNRPESNIRLYGLVISVDFDARKTELKLCYTDNAYEDVTRAACTDLVNVLARLNSGSRYIGKHAYLIATFPSRENYPSTPYVTRHVGETYDSSSLYYALNQYIARFAAGISYTGEIPDPFDYREATHKPTINGVTVNGDLTTEDLGIEAPVYSYTMFLSPPSTINRIGDGDLKTLTLIWNNVIPFMQDLPNKIVIYYVVGSLKWASITLIKYASGTGYGVVTTQPTAIENCVKESSDAVKTAVGSYSLPDIGTIQISITNLLNTANIVNVTKVELVW